MTTYLTDEQMDDLFARIKELRKGHALNDFAKAPYLVIVDGKFHWFKSLMSLRKFLQSCVFPPMYRVFRNADKGVTINLDA